MPNILFIDIYYRWRIERCSELLKEDLIISALKFKYGSELKKIKKRYYKISISNNGKQLILNMKKHQKLIVNIVNDVLSFFDEIKLCDCVFLNGSFSRLTCTYGSDVDFNLIYDNKYRDILFPIELKINYILTKVLNFRGCDRIHSMMVYTKRLDNQNVKLVDNRYLVFNNSNINYFCRDNYEELLSDTFNTGRDYFTLTNYLNDNICDNNIFNEWLFNFKVLYDKNVNFIDYVNDKFYGIKSKDDFIDNMIFEIDSLIKKYSDCKFESICLDGKISISKLKKRYKSNIINCINNTLLILNYYSSDSYLDLYSLIDLKLVDGDLKDSILLALTMINRLHIVLDKLGYDLSSHSTVSICLETFSELYYDLYKSDYLSDLNDMENVVYSECMNTLKRIKSLSI